MFSKGKGQAGDSSTPATAASGGGATPSILSSDLKITGDLIGSGDIQIDGSVTGNVECRVVMIGEAAKVRGDISAKDVRLSGRLEGNVSADSVSLTKSAKVSGRLVQQRLSVEAGAGFEGSVGRPDAAPAVKTREEPVTETRRTAAEPEALTTGP
ncbi:MAG: polymer-forming cytoskeletal protein [Rhodospirillales bacterium]|nr:polymer-forming cytoskeletal protein [Rhodospirillales bacterium]